MTIGYAKVSDCHAVKHLLSSKRRMVSPAFAPGEVVDTPCLRSATSFWVCLSRNVRTRCFAVAAIDPKQSGSAPQTFGTYRVCSGAPPSGTKDTRANEKSCVSLRARKNISADSGNCQKERNHCPTPLHTFTHALIVPIFFVPMFFRTWGPPWNPKLQALHKK